RAVRVKVSIPICTAHTGRYVSIRQVTGMRTARYRAVPPKSTISGRFWPSVVDFDRQRLIEGEKGKKKKKKKKRKRRKKRRRRIPRAVLAHTTPPPVGCPRAVLACTPSPPAGYPRGRKTRRPVGPVHTARTRRYRANDDPWFKQQPQHIGIKMPHVAN
ncbi:hypothetical protein BHE74_00038172, partial [Ensete ventricosum]